MIRGDHADVDPAAVGRGFEVTVHAERVNSQFAMTVVTRGGMLPM